MIDVGETEVFEWERSKALKASVSESVPLLYWARILRIWFSVIGRNMSY